LGPGLAQPVRRTAVLSIDGGFQAKVSGHGKYFISAEAPNGVAGSAAFVLEPTPGPADACKSIARVVLKASAKQFGMASVSAVYLDKPGEVVAGCAAPDWTVKPFAEGSIDGFWFNVSGLDPKEAYVVYAVAPKRRDGNARDPVTAPDRGIEEGGGPDPPP
jgi:hypothetical protein